MQARWVSLSVADRRPERLAETVASSRRPTSHRREPSLISGRRPCVDDMTDGFFLNLNGNRRREHLDGTNRATRSRSAGARALSGRQTGAGVAALRSAYILRPWAGPPDREASSIYSVLPARIGGETDPQAFAPRRDRRGRLPWWGHDRNSVRCERTTSTRHRRASRRGGNRDGATCARLSEFARNRY